MYFLRVFDYSSYYSYYYGTPTLYQYVVFSLLLFGVLGFLKLLQYFFTKGKISSKIIEINGINSPFLIPEFESGDLNIVYKPSIFQKLIIIGLIVAMLILPLSTIITGDISYYYW